ncbi:acyl-CoA reductase-like NAD-dependent aldehyde dehydrogenase [Streptomyces sp. SAI-170]
MIANATVAQRLAQTKFANAGQTCVAPDYVLTDPHTASEPEAALVAALKGLFGADPQTSDAYGRIIHERHFDRLSALLTSGRTVTGGQTARTRTSPRPCRPMCDPTSR